jgi:hypothetical protein
MFGVESVAGLDSGIGFESALPISVFGLEAPPSVLGGPPTFRCAGIEEVV